MYRHLCTRNICPKLVHEIVKQFANIINAIKENETHSVMAPPDKLSTFRHAFQIGIARQLIADLMGKLQCREEIILVHTAYNMKITNIECN